MIQELQVLQAETPTLEALLRLNSAENTDVKTIVMQELEYLNSIALDKKEIAQCLPQSIISAVKTVLKQNLSLDPSAGLVYVQTRSVEVADGKGGFVWKKVLEITPSANGLISINRQCGTILDIKNPVVKKDDNGKVTNVYVEILLPSYGEPRWEKREFDESDFMRWRIASHKQNSRFKKDADFAKLNYANAHYTSWKGGIDPEFARAKAVRHGLKKLGTNQNEKRMIKINVPPTKEVIIDPSMDMEAVEAEYVVAEEVTTTLTTNDLPDAEKM